MKPQRDEFGTFSRWFLLSALVMVVALLWWLHSPWSPIPSRPTDPAPLAAPR